MTRPALMYHDVIDAGQEDASGFPGADAAHYKLTPALFDRHLAAIHSRASPPPLFTFDDGGASAERIADALERCGWRGIFFVTTSRIGRPGFLAGAAIARLHGRGHSVGSHSHTHPLRMAHLSDARLTDEWSRSSAILRDLLGEPTRIASVPGGEYSVRVARAAAAAGIDVLFTSTPTLTAQRVGRLQVVGRFPIFRNTRPETAAALAAGATGPRLLWALRWQTRRMAKRVLGAAYFRARARWLGTSDAAGWGDELAGASEDTA